MFYFVNMTWPERLTGIESAQLKRIKMIDHYNIAAKLVTVNYSADYAQNLQMYGVRPDQVINMYDYLCGIKVKYPQKLTIADLD